MRTLIKLIAISALLETSIGLEEELWEGPKVVKFRVYHPCDHMVEIGVSVPSRLLTKILRYNEGQVNSAYAFNYYLYHICTISMNKIIYPTIEELYTCKTVREARSVTSKLKLAKTIILGVTDFITSMRAYSNLEITSLAEQHKDIIEIFQRRTMTNEVWELIHTLSELIAGGANLRGIANNCRKGLVGTLELSEMMEDKEIGLIPANKTRLEYIHVHKSENEPSEYMKNVRFDTIEIKFWIRRNQNENVESEVEVTFSGFETYPGCNTNAQNISALHDNVHLDHEIYQTKRRKRKTTNK